MFFRKQKSAGNDNRPPPSEPTFVGADSAIEGSIETAGEVRIEGSVRGTVRASVCVISPGGKVEGEVIAEEVIVHGRVVGPLQATHVHLQSGAMVEGDISSETIAIETGARLSGAVWQTGQMEQARLAARPSFDETEGLFAEALWKDRFGGDDRPLNAVKPLASNGARY
jgi:cytoskeletal protein CcmA (bactofilin family)